MSEFNIDEIVEILKSLPVSDLIKVEDSIKKIRSQKDYQTKRELKKKFNDLLNEYGVSSIEQVYAKKDRKEKKHPPRYRFEEKDGNLEWSGYGNRPLWIDEKSKEMNLTREQFLQRFEITPKV